MNTITQMMSTLISFINLTKEVKTNKTKIYLKITTITITKAATMMKKRMKTSSRDLSAMMMKKMKNGIIITTIMMICNSTLVMPMITAKSRRSGKMSKKK